MTSYFCGIPMAPTTNGEHIRLKITEFILHFIGTIRLRIAGEGKNAIIVDEFQLSHNFLGFIIDDSLVSKDFHFSLESSIMRLNRRSSPRTRRIFRLRWFFSPCSPSPHFLQGFFLCNQKEFLKGFCPLSYHKWPATENKTNMLEWEITKQKVPQNF